MAREYGRIWITIWNDEDFLALDSQAQRLYFLLISQPDMNTCGVQSYAPRRWAKKAPDRTPRQIEQSVAALEAARFVVVDRDTDELMVRSHIRRDRVMRTANVAKSLARTFETIASPAIRSTVLVELQRHYDEDGNNGWPGWKEREVAELLSRRPFERSFVPPSERSSA